VLTRLLGTGEGYRLGWAELSDQPVNQPGQRLPARITAQRHPVHPAPEPAQHPPVSADHLRHRGLPEPARPLHRRGDPHRPPGLPLQRRDDLAHLSGAVHHPRLRPLPRRHQLRQALVIPPLRPPRQQPRRPHRHGRRHAPPQRMPVHPREPPGRPARSHIQRDRHHRSRSRPRQPGHHHHCQPPPAHDPTPFLAPIQPQNRNSRQPVAWPSESQRWTTSRDHRRRIQHPRIRVLHRETRN
jgi:hypothetical protein